MPGDALARIRGLINFPSVTEVNVRSGPATSQTLVFKVPVGMSGQRIIDVQIDSENKNMAGGTAPAAISTTSTPTTSTATASTSPTPVTTTPDATTPTTTTTATSPT